MLGFAGFVEVAAAELMSVSLTTGPSLSQTQNELSADQQQREEEQRENCKVCSSPPPPLPTLGIKTAVPWL